jgi:hypothetical protein
MDFDKILDDSNREFKARLEQEKEYKRKAFEEIDRNTQIELNAIKEKYRKESRKTNIALVLCLLPLIFMIVFSFIQAAELDNKADACVNAGGVFAKVYNGYECFSKDSLKTVEVK